MKILGIDPGLNKLGWGLIHLEASRIFYLNSGVIKTSVDQSMHLRLAKITNELQQILTKHMPQKVAMEESFVNMNAKSSLKLAYARGAIMSLIGQYDDLAYYEYLPNKIKKAIVGVGHADKTQVIHMVKRVLSNIPADKVLSPDEADALAVAYSCSVYT
jgi:crossover junction endodeoxyribonuclease RuvC